MGALLQWCSARKSAKRRTRLWKRQGYGRSDHQPGFKASPSTAMSETLSARLARRRTGTATAITARTRMPTPTPTKTFHQAARLREAEVESWLPTARRSETVAKVIPCTTGTSAIGEALPGGNGAGSALKDSPSSRPAAKLRAARLSAARNVAFGQRSWLRRAANQPGDGERGRMTERRVAGGEAVRSRV